MNLGTFDFSQALTYLKEGKKLSRRQFRDDYYIESAFPTPDSYITKPFLVMRKGEEQFPVDLSCESIFGEDWYIKE